MKLKLLTLLLLFSTLLNAQDNHYVYVDNGTLRWKDTNAEANFFGTNYTVPFAYAYRALQRMNIDHKDAIRRDVYHMYRLGLNAFRLHIWDVEIADSLGNIINNEHLDLLDFLVAEVEKYDMAVILTLQTNFGNGYPERDINTGSYSYKYDKFHVHSIPQAIDIQVNYATQLMKHQNPYTNKVYGADKSIVGFEINNEPTHTTDPKDTYNYIEKMYSAMKDAGCERLIFYNVSHNHQHRQAYFDSSVDGATYQWYPSSLVAGHERKGNFMPSMYEYPIHDFDTIQNFNSKAKIVYEFDPGDLATSYQYPLVAHAFRSAGFQWMTQFAYDPTDLAPFNTEYQTHYMNLIFTPQKAISLTIAAVVARSNNLNAPSLNLPKDTVFDCVTVSYRQNLSLLNDGEHFYYTNDNNAKLKDEKALLHLIGYGKSDVVTYSGTGAYFLDKLSNGLWRLEILPDAIAIEDPYTKPSEERIVTQIISMDHQMAINLKDLTDEVNICKVTKEDNSLNFNDITYSTNNLTLSPGVYVLKSSKLKKFNKDIAIAPAIEYQNFTPENALVHTPQKIAFKGQDLEINCTVVGAVDSVVVFPDWLSFWNKKNDSFTMTKKDDFTYSTTINKDLLRSDNFGYYIVAYFQNEKRTYPANINGEPLDWDATYTQPFKVKLQDETAPLILVSDAYSDDNLEIYSLPFYYGAWTRKIENLPFNVNALHCNFAPDGKNLRYFLRKYIGDLPHVNKENLNVRISNFQGLKSINLTLISKDGISYSATIDLEAGKDIYTIDLKQIKQSPTALIPIGYPTYLNSYFTSKDAIEFNVKDIEFVEISTDEITENSSIDLIGIWLN